MNGSLRIGSVRGIPILAHASWIIIFLLLTLSLTDDFARKFPDQPLFVQIALGVTTSLLFFGSVVLHELAHSLLALKYGLTVRAITLMVFGGISEIVESAKQPEKEIKIALAGPIASLVLGVTGLGLGGATAGIFPIVSEMFRWLGGVNILLGLFNLLPGIPLDGGRVLHGIVWKRTGDEERANSVAANTGRGLGYALILQGIWIAFFLKNFGSGLWVSFIGWFLLQGAEATFFSQQARLALRGLKAAQVMTTDCPFVPGWMNIRDFVEKVVFAGGNRCFIVGEPQNPRGIITLADVRAVSADQWESNSIQAAMRPMDALHCVTPETDVEEVLKLLSNNDIAQVLVCEDGRVLGLIGREQVLRAIHDRIELMEAKRVGKLGAPRHT